MFKKIIKVFSILLLAGFSFYYTEKVTKILREKDPIMIKINNAKESNYISTINPIINDDEYIMGINGCEVDIQKSYNKMKSFGEYSDELLVLKEIENSDSLSNKYVISGNKLNRNISIIFFIKDNINDDLIKYIKEKQIQTNFFIDHDYLENNSVMIKFLSDNNNIYYLGKDGKYEDDYMTYINNYIKMITNNESKYCIVNEKNNDILNICSKHNMKTIKIDIIKDNILYNIKNNISNGSIIAIDSNDIDKIKVSINYIISKGYNIVTLDKLLNGNSKCNKK